jgi:flagellin-specific chaperone FliS
MKTTIKHELLASLMLKVIDENKQAQESVESEEWKLGYHEAVDMVLEFLDELNKQK